MQDCILRLVAVLIGLGLVLFGTVLIYVGLLER